ncbi:hypothetical protein VPH35_103224 [Triticum aestivum]
MESLLSILAYAAFFFLVLAVFRRICRRRAPARVIPQPIIEISDDAVTRRALVEYADAFSNRPMSIDNIISVPYGPLWRTLRCNLAAETIHPTRYASYAPLRRAAIDDIGVVVRDGLYAAVFSMIARMCFGDGLVDEADVRAMQCEFREFILAAVESTSTCESKLLGYWRRRQRERDPVALRHRLAELFLPLIEEARRQSSRFCDGKAHSYVDSLIHLRVPDEDDDNDERLRRALTEDEMVSLVLEFLGAGTETVVACVEWTLAHLVTRPEIQNKLRREAIINIKYDGDNKYPSEDEEREILHRGMAPYLHAVVLESLRMHLPTPFVMRDIRAEGGVVGQTAMPAGGLRVHFVLGDIGRDPKTWTDPDEFRPERFLAVGEEEAVGPPPGPKEIKI